MGYFAGSGPAFVLPRVPGLRRVSRPLVSGSGRAEQQPGHRHRGSFAVQAVALLRGGAADFRIVGLEQQSPDSDEIAGRRPYGGWLIVKVLFTWVSGPAGCDWPGVRCRVERLSMFTVVNVDRLMAFEMTAWTWRDVLVRVRGRVGVVERC